MSQPQLTDAELCDRFYKMLWKTVVRKKNGQGMKYPFVEHTLYPNAPSIRKRFIKCRHPLLTQYLDLDVNMLVWCRSFSEMREYVETEIAIKNVLEASDGVG